MARGKKYDGYVNDRDAATTVSGSPSEEEILPQHKENCDTRRGHGLHRCSCDDATRAKMRLARIYMWKGGFIR